MRLLIVTQKVDKEDENLGSFHGWIAEFAKHFSEVFVIANSVGVYTFPKNVAVFSLGKEKGVGRIIRFYRFWRFFLLNYMRSEGVFFHMIPEFIIAVFPILVFRKKITGLWYVHKSVTRYLRFAEHFVDYIFTASPLSFRLPSKKVIYTGHAIDTEFFKPKENILSSDRTLRILTAGRISPIKDYETLICACGILKHTWDCNWTLSIVGGPLMDRDHRYFDSLKRLVMDQGLALYVIFEGSHPYSEMPEIYHNHDLFISMSRTGSIDKSVLEAMASGLSVVTANEAFRDILPTSYFVERRSPEFLAERIKSVVQEIRPNMVLRNIVVEHHGLEKTIKKIAESFGLFNVPYPNQKVFLP